MTAREWPRLLFGILLLAGLTTFVVGRWRMTTDITHFLPAGETGERAALARQIVLGELSRTTIALVEGPDAATAAAASRELEAALRSDAAVMALLATLSGGPEPGFEEALWQIYQPRRFGFAARTPAAAAARATPEGVAAAVAELKRRLGTPMSGLLTRVAPEDPFLILPALFETALGESGEGLQVFDDRYVANDGRSAVLFLCTHAGAADSTAQRPLLAALHRAFDHLAAQQPGLALRISGTNRHAIATEEAMQADVERVSTWSFLCMSVLVVLFGARRLPRGRLLGWAVRLGVPLLLPLSWLPVLAMGFLCGVASCLLAFGQVHGLTLAFGSSLIGVSIDYAVHFFCHEALAPATGGPRATLRRLWPGLVLGALTTILGFVVLLVATFPGLREMALFAATGLASSLLATWLFLPALVRNLRGTALAGRLGDGLQKLPLVRGPARLLLWAPLVAGVVVALLGLPRVQWDDSLVGMNRVDAVLKAEDELVISRITRAEQQRVVIAVGADEEAALQANEAAAAALQAGVADGLLQSFRGVAQLVPSAEHQHAVDAAMRVPGLADRLRAELAAQGFVAERFQPCFEALAAPAPAPLRFADLAATSLGNLVRPFRLQLADGRVAMLSFLRGVADAPALQARLEAVPGVLVIDIAQALTDALTTYRQRMVTLLSIGVGLVVLVVALRYRRRDAILLSLGPALLGAACSVGTLALFGVPMNLLSLVALLMIVSMGVDYGIFLAEDLEERGARHATLIGVLVDGFTTLFGFGMLATSVQPPLFRIGITAAVGITWCLLLALAAGGLVHRRPVSR